MNSVEGMIQSAAKDLIATTGATEDQTLDLMCEVVSNWCSEKGLYVSKKDIVDLFHRQGMAMVRLGEKNAEATS